MHRIPCAPLAWLRTRRLGAILAAVAALLAAPPAFAQVTTATVDLVGPVENVLEFREFPDTTERQLLQSWTFSADGIARERVWFTYSFIDGSLSSRQVTTYDERGMPLVAVTENPDGNPIAQTVFRYDGDGRMLEQASYDAEGVETRRIAYERDASGNAVVEEYWVRGALDRRYERHFDAQGRLIEEREIEDGRLTEVESYTEPGRVAEIVGYGEDGEIEMTGTLVESEHGTEEWTFFEADGKPAGGLFWTYNEDGLVLERRELDTGGREIVYTHAYEFDERGNWVRQEVSESIGGSTSVYEVRDREITYH